MALINITNGTPNDADEVMDNLNSIFNQMAINAIASSRTTSTTDKYIYGSEHTISDYTNSTCFRKGSIAFCIEFDYFIEDVLNEDIWTLTTTGTGTRTVTVVGSGVSRYIEVKTIASGASSQDGHTIIVGDNYTNTPYVDLKKDCELIINLYMISTVYGSVNSSDTARCYLILTDTTNNVTLKEIIKNGTTAGSETYSRRTIRIVINRTANELYYYESLTATTCSTINIAALTGERWFLKFNTYAKNASLGGAVAMTAEIRLYSIGYSDGTANNTVYYTDVQTIVSSTSGFFKINNEIAGSQTVQVSYNNGTNYTTITPEEIFGGVTAGTQFISKITGSAPTTINVTSSSRNIPSINNLQLFYE